MKSKILVLFAVLMLMITAVSAAIVTVTENPEFPDPTDDVEICVSDDNWVDVNTVILNWDNGAGDFGSSGMTDPENDGTFCRTLSATTVHPVNGMTVDYTIDTTYTDGSGPDSTTGDYTYDDEDPVADPNGPYFCDEGEVITLDGSGSSDNVEIAAYEWSAQNGGTFDDPSLENPDFTCYGGDGVYTINLEVTDNGGRTHDADTTVTVTNVAPTADANGPYVCPEGGSVTLDGSGSFDTGLDVLLYEWDLNGDGDYDDPVDQSGIGLTDPVYDCGDGLEVIDITLRVSDEAESDEDDSQITVVNSAPAVDISGPSDVDEGEELVLSVSYDDPWSGDTHTAEVDWDGDGVFEDNIGAVSSGMFVISHTYPDGWEPLSYTVTVRVTDDDSATGVATHDVDVWNVEPTANANVGDPYHAEVDVPFTFDGSATDPANTVLLGDFDTLTYFWVFEYDDSYDCNGDFVVDNMDVVCDADTSGVDLENPTHTYPTLGNFDVALVVCDEGYTSWGYESGCSAIAEAPVTVTDVAIDLHEGWNLVSFPYMPDNNDIHAVIFDQVGDNMPDAMYTVMSYQFDDADDNEWLMSMKDGTGLLDTVIPGYAYWIYLDSADVLHYDGDKFLEFGFPFEVPLAPSSWNLIGKYGNTPVKKNKENSNLGFHNSGMKDLADYPLLAVDDQDLESSDLLGGGDYMLPKEGFWSYMPGNDGFGPIDYIPSNKDIEEEPVGP